MNLKRLVPISLIALNLNFITPVAQAEELWALLGNPAGTVSKTTFPKFDESYLVESTFDYPVSFNGKMRFKLRAELSLSKEELLQKVLAHPETDKWLEGKEPKNVIIVPGKIVNVVL